MSEKDNIFAIRLSPSEFAQLDALVAKFKIATKASIARAALAIGMRELEKHGLDALHTEAQPRTRRKK